MPGTDQNESSTMAPRIDENDGLYIQDAKNVNVAELTPVTPEVISRQATINVGTIGHVAHGKSTVVRALSTVNTIRFKPEKERNITIKLGYANCKVFKNVAPKDDSNPGLYCARSSTQADEWEDDKGKWVVQRHISFVDCPGHDILMATMLNGAAVMDAACLLVAGNETCPQPQTSEHLAAVEIMRLKHILILQNKVELVKQAQAEAQHEEIKKFVAGTAADGAPIIPISAVLGYNIDVVAEYLCTQIPIPVRDFTSSPQMMIIRSFDVNKPGAEIADLQGGVIGGSIIKGVLKVGDEIEIRPGIIGKDASGNTKCKPVKSRITAMHAEKNDLQYAVPGGLIGVGTRVDPTLTRADRMIGQVLGHPGGLPDVYTNIDVSFYLLRRLLGVTTRGEEKSGKVKKLSKGEILMVNIGSTASGGRVMQLKQEENLAKIELTAPVCTRPGDKIALSRRVEKHWRLIGWGEIKKGKLHELEQ